MSNKHTYTDYFTIHFQTILHPYTCTYLVKRTTLHYGQQYFHVQKWANLEFFIDSNGALMKVFEECQFISWACNDTVEYDSVLCTSLVSQIWLRRVCLKAQRQLIGLIDWLNRLRGLVRISGYISHKQMGIQIKADQI